MRLDLEAPGLNGNNGVAPFGGGFDKVQPGAFERIVGTPFADQIVGSPAAETIYGGGGADVILGEGGADQIFGGAEGDDLVGGPEATIDGGSGEDHCSGAEAATSCEFSDEGEAVVPRSPAGIAVGFQVQGGSAPAQLYLAGSSADDEVTATYVPGSPASVRLRAGPGLEGSFDEGADVAAGCEPPTATTVVCLLPEASPPLDSIVLAGLAGNDDLRAAGFPGAVSVMLLGGEGNDHLTGGEQTEDVLVDGPGPGADLLEGLGRDDALMHNGGADLRRAGAGDDLFLSNSICDGDVLDGGAGRDNASWTKLKEPVEANLGLGEAGRPGGGPAPACAAGGTIDRLGAVEDLEGTGSGDFLYGDGGPNQLLGWNGPDSYFAEAGDDLILARSGDADRVIDCGEGSDSAFLDEGLDPAPIGCETVNGRALGGATASVVSPPPDMTPPATRIRHRPHRIVRALRLPVRVAFRFASEPGARFRCRLDRRSYSACRSPRAYRVGRGKHVFRVFAVDAAGNRDRSPAVFRFHVRRLHRKRSSHHHRASGNL